MALTMTTAAVEMVAAVVVVVEEAAAQAAVLAVVLELARKLAVEIQVQTVVAVVRMEVAVVTKSAAGLEDAPAARALRQETPVSSSVATTKQRTARTVLAAALTVLVTSVNSATKRANVKRMRITTHATVGGPKGAWNVKIAMKTVHASLLPPAVLSAARFLLSALAA
jgi:hypothetical protein